MIFKKILIFIFSFSFIVLPLVGTFALAEDKVPGPGEPDPVQFELTNPIKADNFIQLLNLIVDAAMLVLVPLIVIAIMWTGFLFIKARGNDTELTKAKQMFFYVIIGAAIILASKLIITFVSSTIESLKP